MYLLLGFAWWALNRDMGVLYLEYMLALLHIQDKSGQLDKNEFRSCLLSLGYKLGSDPVSHTCRLHCCCITVHAQLLQWLCSFYAYSNRQMIQYLKASGSLSIQTRLALSVLRPLLTSWPRRLLIRILLNKSWTPSRFWLETRYVHYMQLHVCHYRYMFNYAVLVWGLLLNRCICCVCIIFRRDIYIVCIQLCNELLLSWTVQLHVAFKKCTFSAISALHHCRWASQRAAWRSSGVLHPANGPLRRRRRSGRSTRLPVLLHCSLRTERPLGCTHFQLKIKKLCCKCFPFFSCVPSFRI